MLEPYYDSYVAMLDMCGARRRPVTLRAPDFRPDLDELRAAVTDDDPADPAQHPHNPTGTVLTRDELAGRRRPRDPARRDRGDRRGLRAPGLRRRPLGEGHVPIATLPGMWERTLTLSSAGKSYSLHRLEGRLGDRPGSRSSRRCWRPSSGSPSPPARRSSPPSRTRSTTSPTGRASSASDLQARRDLLCGGLTAAGLAPRVPEGTYFATTDISHLGWADGTRVLPRAARARGRGGDPHAGVLRRPGGGPTAVRWAFCKERDVIGEGVRRLAAADLSR